MKQRLLDALTEAFLKVNETRGGLEEVEGDNIFGEVPTNADLAADEAFFSSLKDLFSLYASEERGVAEGDGDLVAVADPIDGSVNMERGSSRFCSAVSLYPDKSELSIGDCLATGILDFSDSSAYIFDDGLSRFLWDGSKFAESEVKTGEPEGVLLVDLCLDFVKSEKNSAERISSLLSKQLFPVALMPGSAILDILSVRLRRAEGRAVLEQKTLDLFAAGRAAGECHSFVSPAEISTDRLSEEMGAKRACLLFSSKKKLELVKRELGF